MMLKRNLLYTGITRGKKLVVLVGTMKAANLAIRTVDTSTRYTTLARFIRGGNDGKQGTD
jgi:exodeoxyribonuclease V alpha subunit